MAITIILAFVALFIFGFPVVVAIAVPAMLYVVFSGFPIELMAQRMTYALDSFPLVAVPVFIFVGSLMNQSGITSDIYRFAHTLGGRVPGGLAQVNVIGSLVFSGTSGAALADIGGLGRIEIRAMVRAGFTRAYSAAIATSGSLSAFAAHFSGLSGKAIRSIASSMLRPSPISASIRAKVCGLEENNVAE